MTPQRQLALAAIGTGAVIATVAGLAIVVAYALLCAVTVLGVRRVVRRLDDSGARPVPPVPAQPDPYELAYLRAGPHEAKRLVMLNLLERGYLWILSRHECVLSQASTGRAAEDLDTVERQFFNRFFAQPLTVREALQARDWGDAIDRRCDDYQAQFEREHFLIPPAVRRRAAALGLVAVGLLVLVWYVCARLMAPAQHATLLLIIPLLVATGALWQVCRLPRLSRLGRAYLRRVRLAYGNLRLPNAPKPPGIVAPELLLLVGICGIGVLDRPWYSELFAKAPAVWSVEASVEGCGACGSGCGSCSGCGGCGGCGN
jgi:uncharacterized protein (TIGR04222 family)